MSKGNGQFMNTEERHAALIAAGFHKLDPELMVDRPPKIKWGLVYQASSDEQKITYLEKLAAAMNHAAHLIQSERDKLSVLCVKKEEQIKSLKKALDQNNDMIQSEITRMNSERQDYNKAAAEANAKIRELEVGNHG